MKNGMATTLRAALASLLIVAGALLLLSSCGKDEDAPQTTRIAVFHSYPDEGEEGEYYRKFMDSEFSRHGVSADIIHIYGDHLHYSPSDYTAQFWNGKMRDSVLRFDPDIIFINDDQALFWAFESSEEIFFEKPVIFGGVTALDVLCLPELPNVTGFEDHIDLAENLKLFRRINRSNSAVIPLDHGSLDNSLRNSFKTDLADTANFVNNMDFHITDLNGEALRAPEFRNKTVATFLSINRPDLNCPSAPDRVAGSALTDKIFSAAGTSHCIQVKYDLFSNIYINGTSDPQISAIREQFGSGDHSTILCGYFTGTDIQITDMVNCACKIVEGTPVEILSVRRHDKKYYMDYQAMKQFSIPLSYKEMSDRFVMCYVPFGVRHRYLLVFLVVLAVAAFAMLAFIAAKHIRRHDASDIEVRRYFTYAQMKQLLLHFRDTYFWMYEDGHLRFYTSFLKKVGLEKTRLSLEEFRAECVHPDYSANFDAIASNVRKPGKYKDTLLLSFDKGGSWHWWEVSYEGHLQAEPYYAGVFTLVDKAKTLEEDIQKAISVNSEIMLKENFLANISHDIRTPLGAVTGFAQLLVEPGISKTDAEQYTAIIHNNSDIMLDLIEDVVARAENEDSIMFINPKRIRIADIVYNCFISNRVLVPEQLDFRLESHSGTSSVMVDGDALRLTQVINNFLSNAFKFTDSGSVVVGWIYDKEKEEVEVYVSDTGPGISDEQKQTLFDRFAKGEDRRHRGTGLGLSICKEIIINHEGSIRVDSELGKGSRFSFRLPVAK